MYKRLVGVFIASIAILSCHNPAGPLNDIHDGLSMSPNDIHLTVGSSQRLKLISTGGTLEGQPVYLHIRAFLIYDKECACSRKVTLGRLERLDHDLFEYIAPQSIRDTFSLPAVGSISFGVGGSDRDGKTLATITIHQ